MPRAPAADPGRTLTAALEVAVAVLDAVRLAAEETAAEAREVAELTASEAELSAEETAALALSAALLAALLAAAAALVALSLADVAAAPGSLSPQIFLENSPTSVYWDSCQQGCFLGFGFRYHALLLSRLH